MMKQKTIKCPYCHANASLRPASVVYGLNRRSQGKFLYLCDRWPACDAYVSAHDRTHRPTFGLDRKIGRSLNAFNDILRGGFGRHEYGQPIHIQWLAYEKSVRNLGKETMDTIVEIILDTHHSEHDCTLERL